MEEKEIKRNEYGFRIMTFAELGIQEVEVEVGDFPWQNKVKGKQIPTTDDDI